MKIAIIGRHKAGIEFCKEFIDRFYPNTGVEELAHLEPEDDRYDVYIGVIPVQIGIALQKKGKKVFYLALPQIPPEARGKELTTEEMKQYGASIYQVVIWWKCLCKEIYNQTSLIACPTCGDMGRVEIDIQKVYPKEGK